MKTAITGGTGFVGSHLASHLAKRGHELVLLARGVHRVTNDRLSGARYVASDLSDPAALREAFRGCEAVAHCAGINREIGEQTYSRVHVEATHNVVQAAEEAGVRKILLMSFLRARPGCGSPYHESKWAAEEIVRASRLDFTIIKAGMVYGRGDHMLDHLCRSLDTVPVFATVGFRQKPIRPLAIEDLVHLLQAGLIDERLSRKTFAVTGAEELYLSDAARRVGQAIHRRPFIFPAPLWFHYCLAQLFEMTMNVPLVAKAQVRILSEGVVDPVTPCEPIPADLVPARCFTEEQIRSGLPERGPFGLRDLRCSV